MSWNQIKFQIDLWGTHTIQISSQLWKAYTHSCKKSTLDFNEATGMLVWIIPVSKWNVWAWIFQSSSLQHVEGIPGLVFLLFLLKNLDKTILSWFSHYPQWRMMGREISISFTWLWNPWDTIMVNLPLTSGKFGAQELVLLCLSPACGRLRNVGFSKFPCTQPFRSL